MNTLIKPIGKLTGKTNIPANLPLSQKIGLIARHINPSKYDFIGFVDRTNEVVLHPRYHNVRNSLGQFAAVVE